MDSQLCKCDGQRERHPKWADSPGDATGCERRHAVSDQDTAETESHMSDSEPNAERVMGNEPHAPRVRQETHRSAGRPEEGCIDLRDRTTRMKTALGCEMMKALKNAPVDVCR